MVLNLPNILSFFRIIISPVFLYLAVVEDGTNILVAFGLFVIGALSDFFDGFFARKYGEITKAGAFFDPIADKFLTTAAFLAFVFLNIIPMWMVIIVIFRDFLTTYMRVYADNYDFEVKTSFMAKVKTFLQMVFIIYILITLCIYHNVFFGIDKIFIYNIIWTKDYNYYFMLILTAFTVWTLIEYYRDNKELFVKTFNRR